MNRVLAVTWGARLRESLRVGEGVATLAACAVTGLCLALCAISELWYLRVDIPLGFDEGYIGALALRLLDGGMLPGVDGVGQRGPVFYWIAAGAQGLFGRFDWYGFRYVTWLAASVVVVSLLGLGMLARRPLAGAIGASFYVWACFHHYGTGIGTAMNGEQLVAPFLSAAAACAALALRSSSARSRVAWAATAGVLAGLAGWTKITMLVAVAPLLLWTVVMAPDPTRPWRPAGRVPAALLGGWLVPVLGVPLIYAVAGELDALVYRFFTYNSQIYMGPYAGKPVWPEIGRWFPSDPLAAYSCLGCACLIVGYVGYLAALLPRGELRRGLSASHFPGAAMMFAALTFASGIAQMRFWGHHFIFTMPWVGLVAGFAIDALIRVLVGRLRAVATIAVAAALIYALVSSVGVDALQRERDRLQGAWLRPSSDPLCTHIQRYAGPKDKIFIWGFDGDLYVSCARNPASRFVYTTLVLGIVPPLWSQSRREWVARDAPAQTLADIKVEKPALILDMPTKLGDMRITKVIELRSILRKQYCKVGEVKGHHGRTATFYARKDRGHCGKSRTSSK